MKKIILLFIATQFAFSLFSQNIPIEKWLYSGTKIIQKPFIIDSLNVKGKAFEEKNLMQSFADFDKVFEKTTIYNADSAKVTFSTPIGNYSMHYFKCYVTADRFVKGELKMKAKDMVEIYIDGEKKKDKTTFDTTLLAVNVELTLDPKRYEIIVKYLASNKNEEGTFDAFFVSKDTNAQINFSTEPTQFYGIELMQNGITIIGVSISPNGKFIKANFSERNDETPRTYSKLIKVESNTVLLNDGKWLQGASWTPTNSQLYFTRRGLKGNELVYVNPTTLEEKVIAANIPEGGFSFTPDEKKLIFFPSEEAPKEIESMRRILDNSDRYNAFRKRSSLAIFDLETGVLQPLTFGYQNVWLNDISADSKKIIFGSSKTDYTKRPFSTTNLFEMNLETLQIDTLFYDEKYLSSAIYSPNGSQLLLTGAPEAFNGIGLNIGNEPIANPYDNQLFLYDMATKYIKPITKYFDPSVKAATWNVADNQIYLLVDEKDYVNLYTYNVTAANFTKIAVPEEVIKSFSVAEFSPTVAFFGQSHNNADRLYVLQNEKSQTTICLEDVSKEKLTNVTLSQMYDFNFDTEEGTPIQGRYYLPPNFDAAKKYPMLVYYYGGTTPTVRTLEFSYSMQMYAALGYVVYTINPSGTVGFGQEFSARHVNAWGKRTAEEIVEGTKLFYRSQNYVDSTKIGCFGASYGGFMTMYLQTITDIYSAAISHAGISALTSYWGEGNWGIGYCAAANADSYPWNNPTLFVEQSPLFHADKIKTPLLLLHGAVDDNVPVGESIQMYNALRILGKQVDFIIVDGENHGISDYKKRKMWAKTMQAYFAKWLKGQTEWWNELYPERKL